LVTGLYRALVDSTEAEPAEVGVRRDVEHPSEEGLAPIVRIDERSFVFPFADEERARVALGWAREVPDDDVEQRVDPCAAQGVGETHGDHVRLIHRALERLVKGFVVRLFALEVSLHECVVDLDDLIEQLRVKAGDWTEVAVGCPRAG
jgi:hypothetical protein